MQRFVLRLLLSIALVAGSATTAFLHAQPAGALDLVICGDPAEGGGTTVITLDASGRPALKHSACPDCLTATAMLLPAGPDMPNPRFGPGEPWAAPGDLPGGLRARVALPARGPPPSA
jgi:hypothetical protein